MSEKPPQKIPPRRRPEFHPDNFPFHNAGRDLAAVDERIAQAQAALDAGYDINELVPRRGRPLDEAVYHDGTCHGGPGNYESLGLVVFLLAHGADPRLNDTTTARLCGPSALEECRARKSNSPFYQAALDLMEEAIRKLEGEYPTLPGTWVGLKNMFLWVALGRLAGLWGPELVE